VLFGVYGVLLMMGSIWTADIDELGLLYGGDTKYSWINGYGLDEGPLGPCFHRFGPHFGNLCDHPDAISSRKGTELLQAS
jgi:hypothetical protein